MNKDSTLTWCTRTFLLGLTCLESEFARGRYLLWNWSTAVGGPDWCRCREFGTRNWSLNILPIGVSFIPPGGMVTMWSLLFKAQLNWDSSIEASILAACKAFLFGFLTPDKSDFERGRIASKKFFTFDVVEGEFPFEDSSPDFLRLRSFEKRLHLPVDPDLGRYSPSTLSIEECRGEIGDCGLWSVSIRGIAIALKSWKYSKDKTFKVKMIFGRTHFLHLIIELSRITHNWLMKVQSWQPIYTSFSNISWTHWYHQMFSQSKHSGLNWTKWNSSISVTTFRFAELLPL